MGYIKGKKLTKICLLTVKVMPTGGYFTWLAAIIYIPVIMMVMMVRWSSWKYFCEFNATFAHKHQHNVIEY